MILLSYFLFKFDCLIRQIIIQSVQQGYQILTQHSPKKIQSVKIYNRGLFLKYSNQLLLKMNSSNQSSATIFSLQTYITELTCYINENNAKYTKNLQTLKHFYEQQIQTLTQKVAILQQQKLQLKNNLLPLRDILNNKQKQLKDTKYTLAEYKDENQSLREKLNNERLKIDHLYEEMASEKKNFRNEIDNLQKVIKDIENDRNDLLLRVKEKEHDITRLQKDIDRLQEQVSERYSLPEKLKDIQIQQAKNKTLLQSLTETKKKLQTKIDFQENQIERLRKENKKLQVNFQSRNANSKKQIAEAIAKQKQSYQQKLKRLQSTNEKQLFEVNELQNSLKLLKKQNSQLQQKLTEYAQELKLLQGKIMNHNTEKDKYIEEFQKLKHQYEEVIKNLEEAIPKYHKKNWDLQQQNRDLNVQLDGLRDVLNEMKAMNTLQPLKHEYRQIAELELLAQKQYKTYQNQKSNKQNYQKSNSFYGMSENKLQQPDEKDQTQVKWDQLLADIDKIQVS